MLVRVRTVSDDLLVSLVVHEEYRPPPPASTLGANANSTWHWDGQPVTNFNITYTSAPKSTISFVHPKWVERILEHWRIGAWVLSMYLDPPQAA